MLIGNGLTLISIFETSVCLIITEFLLVSSFTLLAEKKVHVRKSNPANNANSTLEHLELLNFRGARYDDSTNTLCLNYLTPDFVQIFFFSFC